MEYIREVRVTLYIDTNKRTITREWDDVHKAVLEMREVLREEFG